MFAIALRQEPLSDEDLRTLREWLNGRGARLFQEHMATLAAMAAADSANEQLLWPEEPKPEDKIEAEERRVAARVFAAVNRVMDECRGSDYAFFTVKLEPNPVAIIETYGDNHRDPETRTFPNPNQG